MFWQLFVEKKTFYYNGRLLTQIAPLRYFWSWRHMLANCVAGMAINFAIRRR
jgi:hypothetical protein